MRQRSTGNLQLCICEVRASPELDKESVGLIFSRANHKPGAPTSLSEESIRLQQLPLNTAARVLANTKEAHHCSPFNHCAGSLSNGSF